MSTRSTIFETEAEATGDDEPSPEEARINALQHELLALAAKMKWDDEHAYTEYLVAAGHDPDDAPEHYPARFRTQWNRAKKQAARVNDPLAKIRDDLELPTLDRIVKHGKRGEAYVLELQDGTHVDLGNATQLFVMRQFDAAIMAQAGVLPPARTAKAHRELAGLINGAAELRDTVASPTDETMGWIAGHVGERVHVVHVDDPHSLYDALDAPYPFRDTEGRLYLRLTPLATYVKRMCSTQVTVPELSQRLSRLGFEKNQKGARKGKDTRKQRVWVSPPGFEVTG